MQKQCNSEQYISSDSIKKFGFFFFLCCIKFPVNLLLVLVSVACVIVCNVTAVSAVVGPQLQMDIHSVMP